MTLRSVLALPLALAACGGSIATIDDAGSGTDSASSSDAPSKTDVFVPPPVDAGTLPVDAGPEVYSAVAQPGGLDHLFIQKKDVGRNLCFRIHLVYPSAAVDPQFSVPQPWGFSSAVAIPEAKACDGPSSASAQYQAKDIVGKVVFAPTSPQNPYPKTIDEVQAKLSFPNAPPPVSSTEVFSATAIPVTGI